MLSLIFKPLNYLKIKWDIQGHFSKKQFDIIIPIIVSLIFSVILALVDFFAYDIAKKVEPNIFKNEFTGLLIGFLQTIPGFYIAGLAAISTLNSETMDRPMSGIPPTEKVIETNPYAEKEMPLTRRMFLSRLFSYLSFISLSAFLVAITFKYFYSLNFITVTPVTYGIVYAVCLFILLFCLCQLILLTALGLYYLGDRIHKN
ncbi:hypothetical protein KTJ53_04910 [Acinetobacter variabilis]|uniref:hypothetical protein n=1 Tax=Acinetobacter variabilis TaxID=70346 RepID=UPI0021D1AD08|nr:hypothetical protein [Acinetobacter variabilis]MCU4629044.1 hypothetical protein [Acinetobacter variabilis]